MFCIIDGKYRYTPERYQAACKKCIAILRIMFSDIIYSDVLPTAADVLQIINQSPPNTLVEIITLRNLPELSDNVHHVNPEDFSRFVRIFEDIEQQNNQVNVIGRMFLKPNSEKKSRPI